MDAFMNSKETMSRVIIKPPANIQQIIDVTADLVARHGDHFEETVKAVEANNPHYKFFLPTNPYNAYYKETVRELKEHHMQPFKKGFVPPLKCGKPSQRASNCQSSITVSDALSSDNSVFAFPQTPWYTPKKYENDKEKNKLNDTNDTGELRLAKKLAELQEKKIVVEKKRATKLRAAEERQLQNIAQRIENESKNFDPLNEDNKSDRSEQVAAVESKRPTVQKPRKPNQNAAARVEELTIAQIQNQILANTAVPPGGIAQGLACAQCWGTDTILTKIDDDGLFVCYGCNNQCNVADIKSSHTVWHDFYYRDGKNGEIKGPFVQRQMQEWYTSGFFSENTEFSVNDGIYRTMKELHIKFGKDLPFCVEKDYLIGDNLFYYRKEGGGSNRGPLTAEEMQFLYENDVVLTHISTDGKKFKPLLNFLFDKNLSYPFGVRSSLQIDEKGWNSTNYFFDDGVVKGPFSPKGMQILYEYSLPGSLDHVKVAMVDTTYFTPIADYIEENGCRYPFGRERTEMESDNCDTEFYYIDEDIKGPFVRSQMQCWYEREFIRKNTRISTDKKRFMTLEQLVDRNGNVRPFYGENCVAEKQHICDVDHCVEYYVKDGDKAQNGPYARTQMQHFYVKGMFDSGNVMVRQNDGDLEPLEDLVERNGTKRPFRGNEAENKDEYNAYDKENIKEYYYRDDKTSDIRGPFIAQQMQRFYENELFENARVRFSEDGTIFKKIGHFTKKNGKFTPFYQGPLWTEEREDRHRGFFYRDTNTGVISTPFLEAQMRRWYDNKVFHDISEISIDGGKKFFTLQHLVELNGKINPFIREDENYDESEDLFYVRYTPTGPDLGPFTTDQMQMWFFRKWFDSETRISRNFEEYKPLDYTNPNGNCIPFVRDDDDEEEQISSDSSEDSDVDESIGSNEKEERKPPAPVHYVEEASHTVDEEVVFTKYTENTIDMPSLAENEYVFSEDDDQVSITSLEFEIVNSEFPEHCNRKKVYELIKREISHPPSTEDILDRPNEDFKKHRDISEIPEDTVDMTTALPKEETVSYESSIETMKVLTFSTEEEACNSESPEDSNKESSESLECFVTVPSASMEEEVKPELSENMVEVTEDAVEKGVNSECVQENREIAGVSVVLLQSELSEVTEVSNVFVQEAVAPPEPFEISVFSGKEEVVNAEASAAEVTEVTMEEETNSTGTVEGDNKVLLHLTEVDDIKAEFSNDKGQLSKLDDHEGDVNSELLKVDFETRSTVMESEYAPLDTSEDGHRDYPNEVEVNGNAVFSQQTDNIASDDTAVAEQNSPEPTKINVLAVSMVALLVLLSEGLYYNMSRLSQTTKDKNFSNCHFYSSRLINLTYLILALVIAFSPPGSLKACFTKK